MWWVLIRGRCLLILTEQVKIKASTFLKIIQRELYTVNLHEKPNNSQNQRHHLQTIIQSLCVGTLDQRSRFIAPQNGKSTAGSIRSFSLSQCCLRILRALADRPLHLDFCEHSPTDQNTTLGGGKRALVFQLMCLWL